MSLPDRHLVLPVVMIALFALAACGSSDGAGDSDTSAAAASGSVGSSSSGDDTADTTDTASSSSAMLPDACELVTPAVVEKYFHAEVTAGTTAEGYMGGSECELFASEGGSVLVQTSDQPDTFFPDSKYAEADPVKVTAGDATRGGILLDNGSGTVYVVKGGVGVVVTAGFVSEAEDVTPATEADGQALAAELLDKL